MARTSDPKNSKKATGSRDCAPTTKRSLRIFLTILLAFWVVAIASVLVQTAIFHRSYPHDTLLSNPPSRFSDFTVFYPRFAVYGNPDAFFSPKGVPFTYPAPLLVCFRGLSRFFKDPLAAYLAILSAFSCLTICAAMKGLPRANGLRNLANIAVLASVALCFPLIFLIDRANLEGVVWIAAVLGLFLFVRRNYPAAAIVLALATSMKLFPGVLLLLFLANKRYREFALSVFSCAVWTIVSLWITGPTILQAFRGVEIGAEYLRRAEILEFRPDVIGFDHSLFAFVKWIALCIFHTVPGTNAALPKFYIGYAAAALLGFGLVYFFRLRHMPILNQVLALSALSVLLPFVSYEYTLIHLIVPFIFLILFLIRDVAAGNVSLQKGQQLALLLPYALLFAPATFLLQGDVGLGGQLKTLVLIYLIGITLQVRLPSSLFGELECKSAMPNPVAAPEQHPLRSSFDNRLRPLLQHLHHDSMTHPLRRL